ncbi:hypothetical protein Nepgr_030421 [Nepenthes gracilis]|uniref:Uncharacterized protein n=1 Tax=Nepenthes gracilis TaxID=150966 RepID=A0AAD3TES6_NEPGR|nr:hypothetical protein Nepgr_030421 [Nepenthes gracilis]
MCKKDVEVERRVLGLENQNLNDLIFHSSNGNSRRQKGQPNYQILQFWEIAELGHHHDLMDIKTQAQPFLSTVDDILHHELDIGEQNGMHAFSESQREQGLGVDKLEVSMKVQQMKAKLEIFKRRKIGKDVDYDKLREQLQDVENFVMQLFGMNTELTENIEGHPSTLDAIASPELDKIGKVQKRMVLNEMRRGFERFERLQLQIQKIQYALQKLENKKKSKGRCKFSLIHMGIPQRKFMCSSRQQAFVAA